MAHSRVSPHSTGPQIQDNLSRGPLDAIFDITAANTLIQTFLPLVMLHRNPTQHKFKASSRGCGLNFKFAPERDRQIICEFARAEFSH